MSLVAAAAGVCPRTVRAWIARYQAEGLDGPADRSSRPHRQPRATSLRIVAPITALRLQRQPGSQIARTVGIPRPGELLHLDIKKLARFRQPGHRVTGNRRQCTPGAGWDYVHVCIDDHSRVDCAQIYPDETETTVTVFLRAAVAYFRRLSVA